MSKMSERKPDFERFVRSITTNEPGPVTVGDIFADPDTVANFLGEEAPDLEVIRFKRRDADEGDNSKFMKEGLKFLDQTVRFCCEAGWDYAFSFSLINFRGLRRKISDNTSTEVGEGKRSWMDDNHGPIMSWDDFETYKWPDSPGAINTGSKLIAGMVPDGMQVMVIPGGMFEWTTWLMGLVPFSYALADEPELVDAVLEKVSGIIYALVEDLMEHPDIGGIFMGDDLGYSTGTMVSPSVLREKFFPPTKRIVDLVHQADKVFVLHTCGNVYAVMDDIIEMGVDAKHSFEDKIMPIERVHDKWGDKIALIGGVDMNLLASGTEDEVRKRTREVLEACAPKGHYVLGTGNSVSNYLPLKNYRAMLDEGKKWNQENFGREW